MMLKVSNKLKPSSNTQEEPLFLFVHIPKTAGTSLRVALVQHFKKSDIKFDYGPKSKDTSFSVKRFIYRNNDYFRLVSSGTKVLYGHFPVKKYIRLTDCLNVITFFRDPVDRVLSEYKHFVRYNDYQGSLEQFAQTRRFRNTLQTFMAGAPWSAIGFIGFVEHYNDSLLLLGKKLNIELKIENLNIAPESKNGEFTQQQRQMVADLNQSDISLYNQARDNFMWRLTLYNANKPFTYGGWQIAKNNVSVTGFAFYDGSDMPVTIVILINGKKYETVVANQFHFSMYKLQSPRKGYVGFSALLPHVERHDLQFVNATTRQPLPCVK